LNRRRGSAGSFSLAAAIPGKEDYGLSLESYEAQLTDANIEIKTGVKADAEALRRENFDEVIVSTGVAPRLIDIPGGDDPRVVAYIQVLDGTVEAGERVLIIGGGGIGHDVALFLAMQTNGRRQTREEFFERWGIHGKSKPHPSRRQITMLKRSPGAFGRTLGKSTGWILRQELKDLNVRQIAAARYLKIDDAGLHIALEDRNQILPADTIVVCAGQESNRALANDLAAIGRSVHVIGGARLAGDLDAQRAIYEGAILGSRI
jgi:2,4-dienoyl-CoA reductase (NADPH2)